MIPAAISRLIILAFGVLYPAYESHKTIRTRNTQSYVRWILYWITFSLFICAETFTDIFIYWFPFYYELKIAFVIWLVLPITNGGHILFRYVILPQFSKWEKEADQLLAALDSESLSYVLLFLTGSLHCIADFVVEKFLMAHTKIMDFFKRMKTGWLWKVDRKQGRKMLKCSKTRKVDVTEERQLLNESEPLSGEVIIRTTRAKKYVYT